MSQAREHVTDTEGAQPSIVDRGGFLVRRLHQIWSGSIQRAFREAGCDITSVQYAALETIVRCEGIDQTDLALRIGYDRATTGGLIARLEQAGYLRREPHPRDRRARRLIATPKGRRAAAELRRVAESADKALLSCLAQPDRGALFAALRSLVEAGDALGVAPQFSASGRAGGPKHGARDQDQDATRPNDR